MNIGESIRNFRLQKGLSQGDIENRTGLLRCYLSRMENGHTKPSLGTVAKLATAMGVTLAEFFVGGSSAEDERELTPLVQSEVRFLSQIQRYSSQLNDSERKLVLHMVKKMAEQAKPDS